MGAQVIDDFTGEAVLSDAAGNQRAFVLFDRTAVKAIDALIPRGCMALVSGGTGNITECVHMLVCGSAGYQRRNRGAMRLTNEDLARDVLRDCGGPFVVLPVLLESLSCAEDLGLRADAEVSDGDAAAPLAPPSS